MINALFRNGFSGNSRAFIVFLTLNAAFLFIMLMTRATSGAATQPHVAYGPIALLLLNFGLLSAGLSLLHHNRERRGRLYAQLPVTPLQVRLAYWCHVLLYLCISTLVLVLVMVFADDLSVPDTGLFALLYLAHAGVLMAALSIVTGNTLRLVPGEIRRRTIVYFFLSTFVTFLFLLCIGLVISAYAYVLQNNFAGWGRLTLLLAALWGGLVIADVQLFRKRENYLG